MYLYTHIYMCAYIYIYIYKYIYRVNPNAELWLTHGILFAPLQPANSLRYANSLLACPPVSLH